MINSNEGISVRTVMNAYDQLLVEGYLTSQEKKGYFVADVKTIAKTNPNTVSYPRFYVEEQWFADFTMNQVVYDRFPFATWWSLRNVSLLGQESNICTAV